MEDKNIKSSKGFLMSSLAFPLLTAVACAAVFAGTHMFTLYHVGAFNEIFVVQMFDEGLKSGDFAAAAGFAGGFLLARILEGPLVGVLDIGGSLMTGVGIGIPAMLLAAGIKAPIYNFGLSLVTGAAIGLILGIVIMIIKRIMPKGTTSFGTDIMMGAGNASGRFLGPLIILSAVQYSIPAGIGAFVGAALFYKYDRPIAGGAILGAMILGILFPIPQ